MLLNTLNIYVVKLFINAIFIIIYNYLTKIIDIQLYHSSPHQNPQGHKCVLYTVNIKSVISSISIPKSS